MPTVKEDVEPLEIILEDVSIDSIAKLSFSSSLIIPDNFASVIDSSQLSI
jgi:hypothetical protein